MVIDKKSRKDGVEWFVCVEEKRGREILGGGASINIFCGYILACVLAR